jgi:DNA-binding NarL/FixJ family response regulator
MNIKIGIVDDDRLFVQALTVLIHEINDRFSVIVEAQDGESFLTKLAVLPELPDVVLVDMSMAGMKGNAVAQEMSKRFPEVKKIALSSLDTDVDVILMLRAGCRAYLLKSIDAKELERALLSVFEKGYYHTEGRNIDHRRLAELDLRFSDRELTFLELACSDKTYRQIAHEMYVSERTVDGYRESLFAKLNVQSRVGMALEAIRLHLVDL